MITVTVNYRTEKKEWIDQATAAFAKEQPDIAVKLVGKGSLDSAQAILDDVDKPTVWSPADSMVLELLRSDWLTKNGSPIFADSGEDAPQPLVLTPLVFVAWEDRANALLQSGGGHFTSPRCARPSSPARAGRRWAARPSGASSSWATPIRRAPTRVCKRCS